MVTTVRLRTLLLCTMIAVSTGGSADELVEDAGMVDLEESGGQVVVAGGTVVTLVTKAKKCIRKAAAGDNLSVHYTGRLDGPEGKIFDTSRKETPMPFKFQLGANRVIQVSGIINSLSNHLVLSCKHNITSITTIALHTNTGIREGGSWNVQG